MVVIHKTTGLKFKLKAFRVLNLEDKDELIRLNRDEILALSDDHVKKLHNFLVEQEKLPPCQDKSLHPIELRILYKTQKKMESLFPMGHYFEGYCDIYTINHTKNI